MTRGAGRRRAASATVRSSVELGPQSRGARSLKRRASAASVAGQPAADVGVAASARSAFRITATSMTSWRVRPRPAAGSRARRPPSRRARAPMPTTTLCSGDRRARRGDDDGLAEPVEPVDRQHHVGRLRRRGRAARADRHADVGHGERGRVVDAVADHDRGGRAAASSRTASTFSAGVRSASTSSTPIDRAHRLATLRAVAGDHHDPADAAAAQLADGAGGVGSDRVVEEDGADRRRRRSPTKTVSAAVELARGGGQSPTHGPRRPGHPRSGLADRDRRPVDPAAHRRGPVTSSTSVGERQRQPRSRAARTIAAARTCGEDLVERGAAPSTSSAPWCPGAATTSSTTGLPRRERAGLVEEEDLGRREPFERRRRP